MSLLVLFLVLVYLLKYCPYCEPVAFTQSAVCTVIPILNTLNTVVQVPICHGSHKLVCELSYSFGVHLYSGLPTVSLRLCLVLSRHPKTSHSNEWKPQTHSFNT